MSSNFEELKEPLKPEDKRKQEFERAIEIFSLKHFKRTGTKLNTINFASAKITRLYFDWLKTNVKPFVPKRINKYKIASLAELCIVKVQPFYIENNENMTRKINAEFAFFVTVSLIIGISKHTFNFDKGSSIKRVEDIFDISKTQRIQWLEAKNPNEFPVFSNGLGLFLLFELYALRFQAIQI
ncbi:hypothetical protein KCTC32516_00535 [Polaribacter huanghezhanensis]|uniref:hypothetical protein n=1 Tax=Polaribacter huanghezhanensis TaxID=1354726 RepID=UPI002648B102|nr:hypothetical protein [Polaribacter huanghezhanensis]WKD85195.1 hypothetical protein KCTC32516_00535 [Polaribacter huanghezhanensis]